MEIPKNETLEKHIKHHKEELARINLSKVQIEEKAMNLK
jgi:hypothetical protein